MEKPKIQESCLNFSDFKKIQCIPSISIRYNNIKISKFHMKEIKMKQLCRKLFNRYTIVDDFESNKIC